MAVKGKIKKGEYFDSVTLMQAAKKAGVLAGVEDCAIVMATDENKSILESAGLFLDGFASAGETDVLIAVKASTPKAAEDALAGAESLLKKSFVQAAGSARGAAAPAAATLEGAIKNLPGANLALISVAGRYAASAAREALDNGLNVMLFSDNVPLEAEIELKKLAHEKGLLVMGPDCGTAIINGAPLGFANVVNRGNVGIVAASGTGLQEASCLISNEGAGISQAIGTGGRDLKEAVGGITFLDAMKALAEDGNTKVLLLISKPPHPAVRRKIISAAAEIKKPVVAIFLGAEDSGLEEAGIFSASTLEEAALKAAALSSYHARETETASGLAHEAARFAMVFKGVTSRLEKQKSETARLAFDEARKLSPGQKYLRGLMSGGTFAYEAQLLLAPLIGQVHSNAPLSPKLKLADSLRAEKNSVVDFGEDEFTVGRPHPMIDYSLRNRRIIAEAKDPSVAVLLLDVVLGWGANLRPAEELVPAITEAFSAARSAGRGLCIVASVTGTEADPQRRSSVAFALEKAGTIIMPSNASASLLAGHIIKLAGAGK